MLRSQWTASIVTAAALVAHQGGDPSKQAVRWPLGLRVVQVAEVSRENRFGRREGWIGDENASFQVRSEGEGVAIEIRCSTEGGYAFHAVQLWLTSTTALATAEAGSCTWLWSDHNLAGTVCLVTDGQAAAAEFEIYDGAEAEYGEAYFGRVDPWGSNSPRPGRRSRGRSLRRVPCASAINPDPSTSRRWRFRDKWMPLDADKDSGSFGIRRAIFPCWR